MQAAELLEPATEDVPAAHGVGQATVAFDAVP